MKILIIGSGGREHALANCFTKSEKAEQIFVAPGNAGIALQHQCVPLTEVKQIIHFCQTEAIDFVFIGPEQPIAEGWADAFREKGIKVVAPSRLAARLETSKSFAKQIMADNGIPTAKYSLIHNILDLQKVTEEMGYPIVLKADGLAAGKGVIIAEDWESAEQAYFRLLNVQQGVVAEEFLSGWEVSLFAVTDGVSFQTTVFAQDHKQLSDHDLGPNTGGMGAYAPVPEAQVYQAMIEDEIIQPVLKAMHSIGCQYQGVLYIGLMITAAGPKVVEFNCRLGDPEAQVVLPLLETDLVEVCDAIMNCEVDKLQVKFINGTALGVVLASQGYPAEYLKGMPIKLDSSDLNQICFSGVTGNQNELITAGGRVLCVLGTGDNIQQARDDAYSRLNRIDFKGKTYRSDIGLRLNRI